MLDKILEHDRWKTEATFAHQLQIQEMKLSAPSPSRRSVCGSGQSNFSGLSEDDVKFNNLSSYGACTDKHFGLMAKTKVWEGARDLSSKLYEKWYSHIQDNNVLPLKDLKEGRIKTLLCSFLWASGCGHRMAMWPEAPDSNLVDSLRKEVRTKVATFSKHSIVAAYESLKEFWKEINDYEQTPFNVSLIGELLDEAYSYVNQKAEEENKTDIKKSPLFAEFEKTYPYVPLDVLEKYYIKNRKNFIAGGVGALRRTFTTLLPVELEHKYSAAEWPKKWHLHIASFEEKWQQSLHDIMSSTREAQEQWKKD